MERCIAPYIGFGVLYDKNISSTASKNWGYIFLMWGATQFQYMFVWFLSYMWELVMSTSAGVHARHAHTKIVGLYVECVMSAFSGIKEWIFCEYDVPTQR